MIEVIQDCEYISAEKQLLKILREAEEFDVDKDAWMSLEELREILSV